MINWLLLAWLLSIMGYIFFSRKWYICGPIKAKMKRHQPWALSFWKSVDGKYHHYAYVKEKNDIVKYIDGVKQKEVNKC